MMVEMGEGEAATHVLKDVEPGEGTWRWTGQQPTLKILAFTTENVKLRVDFTLWDVAFHETGPVELSFFVNGHLLDKIRYSAPGYQHFEKPIPADWLTTDVESTVSIVIDKMYTAPQDGKKFGFILSRIGFAL
jgi:hypothetical protein